MDTASPSAQHEVMTSGDSARRATTADAAVVAQLLHDFNTEFSTPTPDVCELQSRLTQLLAGDDVVVLLIGEPAGMGDGGPEPTMQTRRDRLHSSICRKGAAARSRTASFGTRSASGL